MGNKNTANEPMGVYETPATFEQVWKMFIETDKMFKETEKRFEDTDKRFKETDKKIKELSALFTSQWGKLVESLVKGDLIKLLNERGIEVRNTMERVEGNVDGENFEYDIIAENGKEVVIVEVKTTLRVADINNFHRKIWKAKQYLPRYKDNVIYGALAFITADGSSDEMAEKMGFFVIRATGNSSSIINKKDFKPKAF